MAASEADSTDWRDDFDRRWITNESLEAIRHLSIAQPPITDFRGMYERAWTMRNAVDALSAMCSGVYATIAAINPLMDEAERLREKRELLRAQVDVDELPMRTLEAGAKQLDDVLKQITGHVMFLDNAYQANREVIEGRYDFSRDLEVEAVHDLMNLQNWVRKVVNMHKDDVELPRRQRTQEDAALQRRHDAVNPKGLPIRYEGSTRPYDQVVGEGPQEVQAELPESPMEDVVGGEAEAGNPETRSLSDYVHAIDMPPRRASAGHVETGSPDWRMFIDYSPNEGSAVEDDERASV